MKMQRRTALLTLNFPVDANPSPQMIQDRFRELAKSGHADHGGNLDMKKLRDAKAVLNAQKFYELIDCSQCAGTGKVRGTGFAPVTCKTCNGTGQRRENNG